MPTESQTGTLVQPHTKTAERQTAHPKFEIKRWTQAQYILTHTYFCASTLTHTLYYTYTPKFVFMNQRSWSSQTQSVPTHSPIPRLRLPAWVPVRVHLSTHKVPLISQLQAAITRLLSPHLGSPMQPGPPPTVWGPEGWAGDWGPCNVASASLIRGTWRLEKVDTHSFQSSTPKRGKGRVCETAKISGPVFLKPCWVCSKEGQTPAHRLRATKEGR